MNAGLPELDAVASSTPGSRPLDVLLARVREEDDVAARELVDQLYPLVAQVVHAHLPRRDDPEDLMQEVFLKLFRRLDQFRHEAPFEHWVTRVTLTTCLDRLRRQQARPELRWADLAEDELQVLSNVAGGGPAADGDAAAARTLVEQLLERLPATDAWLIRQVELEERTLAQVCLATGWNPGAARVRLFRARQRLRAAFRKLERGLR